jgi:hypothetical protein
MAKKAKRQKAIKSQVGCIPCTINGIRIIEWMNDKTP